MREAASGSETIESQATTIRELFKDIGARYPKLQEMVDNKQLAVSIDGTIFRDNWQEPITCDAEIWVLPRIAGG